MNLKIPASQIKGFNYHPSYSSCPFETWRCFDFEKISEELTRGKEYFPNFNTVRIWLSWNAFCRGYEVFLDRLDMVLEKCKQLGIYVMPVIFNRWHDPMVDCDGVYLEHIVPNTSWFDKYGDPFDKYLKCLMERFGDDDRIICWDLCNEPFAFPFWQCEFADKLFEIDINWLQSVYDKCKAYGAKQPLGIGEAGVLDLNRIDSCSDIFYTHMYFRTDDPFDQEGIAQFDHNVKLKLEQAKALGKDLVPNECCWGDYTDQRRAQRVKVTLETFKKHGIGYCLYALNYCDFPDLHDECDGAYSPDIGNLAFVTKDGKIRPGHEIVNEY